MRVNDKRWVLQSEASKASQDCALSHSCWQRGWLTVLMKRIWYIRQVYRRRCTQKWNCAIRDPLLFFWIFQGKLGFPIVTDWIPNILFLKDIRRFKVGHDSSSVAKTSMAKTHFISSFLRVAILFSIDYFALGRTSKRQNAIKSRAFSPRFSFELKDWNDRYWNLVTVQSIAWVK